MYDMRTSVNQQTMYRRTIHPTLNFQISIHFLIRQFDTIAEGGEEGAGGLTLTSNHYFQSR